MIRTTMLLALAIGAIASVPAVAEMPIVAPSPPPYPAWCPTGRIPGVEIHCDLSRPTPKGTRQVDVTLRIADDVIWKGTLSFANYNGASISQNRTDSFACQPIAPETRSAQQSSTSFSIRLSGYQDGLRVPVAVEVTRPFDEAQKGLTPCYQRGLGTKTTRFETQVELVDGKPVTVQGDGGLSVTLVGH